MLRYLGCQNVEGAGWKWDVQAATFRLQSKRDATGRSAAMVRDLIEAITAGAYRASSVLVLLPRARLQRLRRCRTGSTGAGRDDLAGTRLARGRDDRLGVERREQAIEVVKVGHAAFAFRQPCSQRHARNAVQSASVTSAGYRRVPPSVTWRIPNRSIAGSG